MKVGAHLRIELEDTEAVNYVRPSADVLFFSVAERYRSHALAIVHTGIGKDGAAGAAAIAEAGGSVMTPVADELDAPFMARATQAIVGAPCRIARRVHLGDAASELLETMTVRFREATKG